jgi:hypothetical protein
MIRRILGAAGVLYREEKWNDGSDAIVISPLFGLNFCDN